MNKIIEKCGVLFEVSNDLEEYRVCSLLDKEPETIAWIDSWSSQNSNNVFYDIGSNIGIYSLYAASKTSYNHVYSFEPVSSNFLALMKNIALNRSLNINSFNVAISNACCIESIYISDSRVGNSGAQIGKPVNEYGEKFEPIMIERVLSFTLDDLVYKFNMPKPNYIKIDVDGCEDAILSGMKSVLLSEELNSILIEINNKEQISKWINILKKYGFVSDLNFEKMDNHSTHRRILKGTTARNCIFNKLNSK